MSDQISEGAVSSPTVKPKRAKPLSPKQIKAFSRMLGKISCNLKFVNGERYGDGRSVLCDLSDPEVYALGERLWQLDMDLWNLARRRELQAAERKDARLLENEKVLWTVFHPDTVLGTNIITRTPNRLLTQRVPTEFDLLGIALFGDKNSMDRFKLAAESADPKDAYADLQFRWKNPDAKAIAAMDKRVDEVMAAWKDRFKKAREEEGRKLLSEAEHNAFPSESYTRPELSEKKEAA